MQIKYSHPIRVAFLKATGCSSCEEARVVKGEAHPKWIFIGMRYILRPFYHINGWKIAGLLSPKIKDKITFVCLLFLEVGNAAEEVGLAVASHEVAGLE